MLVNNVFIHLPKDVTELYHFSKNVFDPNTYRDLKRNINRINNIDNEIYYRRSLSKINTIDFVNKIKITKEEYENAIKYCDLLYNNLTEDIVEDLFSHKKLLIKEKHLIEIMNYFFGIDNFDWNLFKLNYDFYKIKTKIKSIDYSNIKKKRINIMLGQLCQLDKIDNFLDGNDFYDNGMKFVYEWVKCQLKIYFYLYQNKKLKKLTKSNSSIYSNKDINSLYFNNFLNKKYNYIKLNKSNSQADINKINNSNDSTFNNTMISNKNIINNSLSGSINSRLLMTSLPIINSNNSNSYILNNNEKNIIKNKSFKSIEARKVNFKLRGYDKELEKIFREIKTAEMLPFLKHRTFHQMREFFEINIPLSKKVKKQHIDEIKAFSLNNAKNSKRIISLIAHGNIHILNYVPQENIENVFGINKKK